jgi:hypothetical protein
MKRGTIDHPKTVMLSTKLGGPRYVAVGILEALWHWASRYAIRGDIGKWSNEVIAKGVYWDGDPELLIQALLDSKWIDKVEGPCRMVIHDICDHADNTHRQCLADAGLTFWNGLEARSGKKGRRKSITPAGFQPDSSLIPDLLQSNSSETPEELQNNSSEIPVKFHSQSQSQSQSHNTPYPLKGDDLGNAAEQEQVIKVGVCGIFRRKESTQWSGKELKKLREIARRVEALAELKAIKGYYERLSSGPPDKDYRRRDVLTFLNNWTGELDRANQGSGGGAVCRREREVYRPMSAGKVGVA